jgi:hypothetical protein
MLITHAITTTNVDYVSLPFNCTVFLLTLMLIELFSLDYNISLVISVLFGI